MKGSSRGDTRGGLLDFLDRYPFTIGVALSLILLFLFAGQRSGGWPIQPDLRVALGSNVSELLKTEPWRLLTCMFLHYDLIHLIVNVTALIYWGRLLEIHYGSSRLWTIFLACGLCASLCSAAWQEFMVQQGLAQGSIASVGASGAVFGLLFLGLVTAQRAPARLGSLIQPLSMWIGAGLVFTLISGGAIDHAAHVGGALCGAFFAWKFPPRPGEDLPPAWTVWAITGAIAVLACFARVIYGLRTLEI